jgi:hypothetical protein
MLDLRLDHGALGFLLQVLELRHDERLRLDRSSLFAARSSRFIFLEGRLTPALSFLR